MGRTGVTQQEREARRSSSKTPRAVVFSILAAFLLQTMGLPTPPPVWAVDPPVASFTPTSQYAGLAPLVVDFTDTSTGSPSSWLWDFGDGDTSTIQHPAHTYRLPGRYTVTLTATNEGGADSEVRSAQIVVHELLSTNLTPLVDPNFNATITAGGAITDLDWNTKGDVCGAPPNNGFYYDLGVTRWISRVRVKAMHASSSYSSRIAVYASNVDPSGGSPAWTKIYDTNTNTSEGGIRDFPIPQANGGPWRYMRFQMVSRSISSTCNRWFGAETYGVDPAIIESTIVANFSPDRTVGTPQAYDERPNFIRYPQGEAPTRASLVALVLAEPSLVSLWPLEDRTSDTSAADATGGNHLVRYGSYLVGQDGAVADSRAYQFRESNSYLQDSSPTGLPVGASPRTVEFWYRGTSGAKQTVFSYGSKSTRQSFAVAINEGGTGRIGAWTYGNDGSVPATQLLDGRWHHIAVTYNGGTAIRFYVDGTDIGGFTLGGTLNTVINTNGLVVGRDYFQNSNWFNSHLDEVAIYDGALSAETLATHAIAGLGARYSASESYSATYAPGQAADGVANNSGEGWAVNGIGAGDLWRVDWLNAQTFDMVRLWDRAGSGTYFGNGKLVFSDGSEVTFSGLPDDAGSGGTNYLDISFPAKTMTSLQVVHLSGGAGNAGFAEVAAYDSTDAAATGMPVRFTDLATGDPVHWYWNFGDGATSTAQHPVHYYADPGAYTVSLRAKNADGESNTRTVANLIVLEGQISDLTPPVPMNGAAFYEDSSSTIPANGVQIVDASDSTYDHVTGCCPQSVYLDLGSEKAVSAVTVSMRHSNSAAYASRFRIYGGTTTTSWTLLHDDMGNQSDGPRRISLGDEDRGAWRYVRFEQVSRSIGSGNPRWLVARVFGATPIEPTGDTTPPSAEFLTPGEGDLLSNATGAIDLDWSEADPESGVAGRYLQRQLTAATAGDCADDPVDWDDDGVVITEPAPVTASVLPAGNCYRWRLTVEDNAGNQRVIFSGELIVDDSPPAAPTVTDNTALVPGTFRNGGVIFFDNTEPGTVELTSSSGDPQTAVASHALTDSREPGNPSTSSGNYETFAVSWGAGEPEFSVALVARNAAGLDSSPSAITFSPDAADPVVAFSSPAPGSSLRTVVPEVSIVWSELEEESGIMTRSLQRQRADVDGLQACLTATFVADGQAVNGVSPVSQSLAPSNCYRWVQTITDAANRSATATSGIVYVAPREGPITTYSSPPADYVVLADLDFEDTDEITGWPGTRLVVGGDHEMAIGGITEAHYGPQWPATPSQRYRLSIRPFPAGPHADIQICFWDNADAMTCAGKISEGDQRDQVVIREATSPAGTVEVGIRWYHAYYTSYYDDLRFERLSQNADDTVMSADELTVEWSEEEEPDGLPVATRSLQRQRAAASSYTGCATVTFVDDGVPSALVSPVEEAGLQSGYCYRWVQTLTDADGNARSTLSGTRYIVDHELAVHVAPSAVIGATAPVSVVLSDRDGEPRDDFVGTLTISTDDPEAVFPGGSTFAMDGPDTQAGHTFRVLFGTPGTHAIVVRGPNAAIGTATVDVAGIQLTADAPAQAHAGIPFLFTVTPNDDGGRLATGFGATVSLASSDATATFTGPDGATSSVTLSCTCDGGEQIQASLTALGVQTITATDQFGNSAQATVQVLAAPGGMASPISRVDNVQWDHGRQADLYVTAAAGAVPFTILSSQVGCEGDTAMTPVGISVNPAVDRYVEFRVAVPNEGICANAYLSEILGHQLTVTDAAGHLWTVGVTQRHQRFAGVPGNVNFEMLNPGDPIAAWGVTARPGGTEKVGGPDGHSWAYGANSLQIEFQTSEPAMVEELAIGRPGITGYVVPWRTPQGRGLPLGQSWANFDDITHVCYIGGSWQNASSGWIKYTTLSGYGGAIASGGGILPGPGSPTATCGDITGNPNDKVLDDVLDALNPETWTNTLNGMASGFDRFLEGDPVDPFNGAFTQTSTDFSLGGLSPALRLERTYRSDRAEAGAAGDTNAIGVFGRGWSSTVDRRLIIYDGGDRVEAVGDDGGYITFTRAANGDYGSTGALTGVTLAAEGGGYRLTSLGGSYSRFDTYGRLTAVGDRSGRELSLAYDGDGHLASMTDAASRTATFVVDGAGRVTGVSLPDGRDVAFTYNSGGDLATSRDLAGNVTNWITDSRGRIVEVRDAGDELLLANTYDGAGRLIEQVDALGFTSFFEYDSGQRLTRYLDPRGAVSTSCYDTNGRQVGRIDALGSSRAWTYDANGQPASAADELGQVTRFEHTADGLLTDLTDPLGRTVGMSYRPDGQLLEMVEADGNQAEATYDPNGLLTTITRRAAAGEPQPQSVVVGTLTYTAAQLPETIADAVGASSTFEYDSRGYVVAITDPEDRRTTFAVDARGYVTASVDAAGNAVGGVPADHTLTSTYDDMGRVLNSTDQLGNTTTYTYDDWGRLATVTTPLGFTTENAYNLAGQLTSTTTELTATATATTSFEYDPAGNLTAVIDAEERRTEFEYDLLGRQVLLRDPSGAETTTEYDAAGQVVRITDPTGRSTQTVYDAAGRVTTTIDAAGEETTYAYDDLDQLVGITDPLEHTTTYGYDWMGRQVTVTDPLQNTTTREYDNAGRLTSVSDPLDHATTFTYNLAGQLTLVVDAEDGEWSFEYDDAGRLERRINARGKAEVFDYDNAGRPTTLTDPSGQTWQTAYDADGRIDYTVDGEDQTTNLSFDRGGRLLTVTPAVGSAINFSYDDSDLRLSMTDANGSTAYIYDPAGRLTSLERNGRTVGYAYDDAGRPTAVSYPGGAGSVGYAYDSAGRLDEISDWASRATTFTYDAASRIDSIARPNGVSTELAYDDANRTTGITHNRTGSALLSLTYGYDDASRLTTMTDDLGTATFTYDDLGRLLGADYPGTGDYAFAYDPVGNMTAITQPGSGPLTRSYDDVDRLITEDDSSIVRTFSYDDNGSLLDDGAGRTFSYDALGRLTGVSESGLALTYTLDGEGNRWAETANSVTTSFDLDLNGMSSVLFDGSRLYLPGDPAAGYQQSGAWVTGLTDLVGSPMGYVDAAGTLSALTHFDPFGSPRGTDPNPLAAFGFTGEWTDPAGLVNLRFRAYDPTLQRFLGRDTFGGVATAGQSWNRHAYAGNNPFMYSDPSGHLWNAFVRDPGLWTSIGLQMLPGVGDLYSGLTGLIGFDPIAGYSLSEVERGIALAAAATIGGGFHLLGHVADRPGDALANLARNERRAGAAEDVGDLARTDSRASGVGDMARVGGDARAGAARGSGAGGAPETVSASKEIASYYPPNRGFLGEAIGETLTPGTRISRFGREGGTFASPEGTPAAMRSLSPGAAAGPYSVYEVVNPIQVKSGTTAPWFGQIGLGTQYELPASVADLIEAGLLKRVGQQ